MIDALRRASAARITAVIPVLRIRQARQEDAKAASRSRPRSIANLLKVTGAKRIVTMDLHAAQIQGFFDIPVDNLMAMPVLCNYLKKEGLCDDKIVVVSPDAGGVHRAELFAKRLNSSLAIVFKRRPEPDVSEVTDIVGDVAGKVAVDRRRHDLDRRHAREGGRSDQGARRDARLHGRVARHLRRRRGRGARAIRRSRRCIVTNTVPFDNGVEIIRSSCSSRSRRPSPTRSAASRPIARSRSSSPATSHRSAVSAHSCPKRLRPSSRVVYKGSRGYQRAEARRRAARQDSVRPARKRLRARRKIPAVLYGHGAAPEHLAIDAHAFEELLHRGGRNAIITLTGGSAKRQTALVREIQHHPVSRRVMHADLQRVSADETIDARLPIVTVGVAEGVRNSGGVMDVITHELEIEGPANQIPGASRGRRHRARHARARHRGRRRAARRLQACSRPPTRSSSRSSRRAPRASSKRRRPAGEKPPNPKSSATTGSHSRAGQ